MNVAPRNLVLAALAAALIVIGVQQWRLRSPSAVPTTNGVGTPAAQTPATRTTVAALGRLEPQGGVIDVGGVAGERVERISVAEGDAVKAGDELALLSSFALRTSELQLAEIQLAEATARSKAEQLYGAALVAEAEAALAQLKLGDLDVQALKAKIESLEVNKKIALRDLERLDGAGSVVSPQEHDHQELRVEQAKAELHAARAQLDRLEAARETSEREAQARMETAKANQSRLHSAVQLDSLEKAVATAKQKLELSIVRAPRDGRVLRIVTLAGENVGPRPILHLGDTDHMYATAEIYETDVRFLRKGQRATITSDALMKPLTGTVESVGMTVAKNEVVSLDPTASADARVVRARIRLDDSSEAAGLVDLQVDVLIDTAPAAAAGRPSTAFRGG